MNSLSDLLTAAKDAAFTPAPPPPELAKALVAAAAAKSATVAANAPPKLDSVAWTTPNAGLTEEGQAIKVTATGPKLTPSDAVQIKIFYFQEGKQAAKQLVYNKAGEPAAGKSTLSWKVAVQSGGASRPTGYLIAEASLGAELVASPAITYALWAKLDEAHWGPGRNAANEGDLVGFGGTGDLTKDDTVKYEITYTPEEGGAPEQVASGTMNIPAAGKKCWYDWPCNLQKGAKRKRGKLNLKLTCGGEEKKAPEIMYGPPLERLKLETINAKTALAGTCREGERVFLVATGGCTMGDTVNFQVFFRASAGAALTQVGAAVGVTAPQSSEGHWGCALKGRGFPAHGGQLVFKVTCRDEEIESIPYAYEG